MKKQKGIKEITTIILSILCLLFSGCTVSPEDSQSSTKRNEITIGIVYDVAFKTQIAYL